MKPGQIVKFRNVYEVYVRYEYGQYKSIAFFGILGSHLVRAPVLNPLLSITGTK